MLSAQDITELLLFKAPAPDVLSVYFPIEKDRETARDLELLLKDVPAGNADKARVLELTRTAPPEGALALAAFASSERGLWKTAWLPQPAGPYAKVEAAPRLEALLNAADQYQRYLVAQAGENEAKFLEIFMGECVELESAARERASQTRNAWLRSLAERLLRLSRLRKPNRFILGAAPDLASALTGHCHTILKDNLILDPQLGPQVTAGEAAARVGRAELESRAVRESVLTHRMLDAAKAGMGVTGLFETLAALQREQVRLLLVRGDLARIGRRCQRCRHLALSGRKCDACGGATDAVFNIVAEMTQLALESGCEVFRVLRDRGLDSAGGIGAELRFPAARTSAPLPTSRVI